MDEQTDKADITATWPERCPVCGVEWTIMLGRKTVRTIEWRCDACQWRQTFRRPSRRPINATRGNPLPYKEAQDADD